MGAKRTAFMVDVTDEDVVDVWFDVKKGRVVAFSINYRALIEETWTEVVRYDTAHEHLHVHEFWPRGSERIISLEQSAANNYTEALSMAMDELDANWRQYRRKAEAHQ